MVIDILKNVRRYQTLHGGFEKAADFLLRPDIKHLPEGRYEIDGDRIYASVSRDPGQPKEAALLETHEKYIDIQLVLEGTDDMGWKPKGSCERPSGAYDPDTDLQFFSDEPATWLGVKEGTFVIFFPEDAHMPLIGSEQIRKVVVKIAAV